MPEEIWRSNRDQFGMALSMFCSGLSIMILLLSINLLVEDPENWGILILGVCMAMMSGLMVQNSFAKPNVRFEVYRNGFIPAVKGIRFYFMRKEWFVHFADIRTVEFGRGGFNCDLGLSGEREVQISTGWYDIDGYVRFVKLLQ